MDFSCRHSPVPNKEPPVSRARTRVRGARLSGPIALYAFRNRWRWSFSL